MLNKLRILFLGAGSMAEAMISGLVKSQRIPARQIIATNRSNSIRLTELEKNYGIKGIRKEKVAIDQADIIILAMKPKDFEESITSIKNEIQTSQLILSVMAGISTNQIAEKLREGQQVIRVMPNTSSMVGESATAIVPGKKATASSILLAEELLACLGTVYHLDEEKIDIFTGIAGSGPAYFYYLMEHIERAGREGGLDAKTATQIVAQTILGAAKMAMHQNETPSELREKVTSPNGTTAAGLEALKIHGAGIAMFQAVQGATKRSKEISWEIQEMIREN
ncbi:pyrroline-5-carboxylate reductase [Neobacillus cucumis]|uniref:pyrroline-5-carboxylate reductase n=1 Tax=Neobacillus cucumis TaxID=1740721 RepID=UPI0028530881|nr:pyrroline-5-carboxylate reductase [Neobacillus cucumis]MDR4947360.1 pyrroline-5-carboxylate reductase [Neobacillus cucumis]